jgi:hypothetical protein
MSQNDIQSTLAERQHTHGHYKAVAFTIQNFKFQLTQTVNWQALSPEHKESLEMIVHKIGRILNGDPNHNDSWHDIAGYATLGERACKPKA